jgi:DNA ligase-1
MLLRELAATSADVAKESGKTAKTALLADLLRRADPAEVPVAVTYLSGDLPQRQIGVGWASLQEVPAAAAEATLTVAEVDRVFTEIGAAAGTGSRSARRALLTDLFGRATDVEQTFLRRLLTGELRQGALDGVMADAVAKAAGVPAAEVRRAAMLSGELAAVAATAIREGAAGLKGFGLVLGRPVQPMLAGSADSVAEALEKAGPEAALEWKLDGIRVQIHRTPEEVRVFTRSLDDITERLPEVVAAARALPVRSAVLDGEAIALRTDGTPEPFQVTASRTGSRQNVEKLRAEIPLTVFLFDVLHLDGADLMDLPGHERARRLAAVAPPELVAPRLVTASPEAGEAFFRAAVAAGHEGVVVKALDAPYAAGRRGSGWVKVKPRHTLDLVVIAAEWGHGRRHGWLSNLHLAARDPETGGYVMLGKTFKGMTDELLAWQTEQLQAIASARDEYTVWVRPELVVEVAFDGVQRSSRYPGGVTLRFARILRYRDDKSADQADTIEMVRAIGG